MGYLDRKYSIKGENPESDVFMSKILNLGREPRKWGSEVENASFWAKSQKWNVQK